MAEWHDAFEVCMPLAGFDIKYQIFVEICLLYIGNGETVFFRKLCILSKLLKFPRIIQTPLNIVLCVEAPFD